MHDWGGLIGLRWACDHPGAVWALVISDTGFFPEGRWHDMAEVMRTPGRGEELVDAMTEAGFAELLGGLSSGIGADAAREYFRRSPTRPAAAASSSSTARATSRSSLRTRASSRSSACRR